MFNWKLIVTMALPMLEAAAYAKKAEDENDTGKDDVIGEAMLFAAKLLKAIVTGKDLPKAPASLK